MALSIVTAESNKLTKAYKDAGDELEMAIRFVWNVYQTQDLHEDALVRMLRTNVPSNGVNTPFGGIVQSWMRITRFTTKNKDLYDTIKYLCETYVKKCATAQRNYHSVVTYDILYDYHDQLRKYLPEDIDDDVY